MIHVGSHKHYDTPPTVPMFGMTAKPSKGTNLSEALSSVAEGLMRVWKTPESASCSCSKSTLPASEKSLSPINCATLRSQHIQQLKELHQLLEVSAISQDEYVRQKDTIFEKMKEL